MALLSPDPFEVSSIDLDRWVGLSSSFAELFSFSGSGSGFAVSRWMRDELFLAEPEPMHQLSELSGHGDGTLCGADFIPFSATPLGKIGLTPAVDQGPGGLDQERSDIGIARSVAFHGREFLPCGASIGRGQTKVGPYIVRGESVGVFNGVFEGDRDEGSD